MKVSEVFQPRAIDRVLFGILAVLHVASASYLIGPWYLTETPDGKAPIYTLFNSAIAVTVYGALLMIDGLFLLWTAAKKTSRVHTFILEGALLGGFLLRLYALIGVFLVAESWRPPSYLSHMATIVALGAYWVWVRVSVRPIK